MQLETPWVTPPTAGDLSDKLCEYRRRGFHHLSMTLKAFRRRQWRPPRYSCGNPFNILRVVGTTVAKATMRAGGDAWPKSYASSHRAGQGDLKWAALVLMPSTPGPFSQVISRAFMSCRVPDSAFLQFNRIFGAGSIPGSSTREEAGQGQISDLLFFWPTTQSTSMVGAGCLASPTPADAKRTADAAQEIPFTLRMIGRPYRISVAAGPRRPPRARHRRPQGRIRAHHPTLRPLPPATPSADSRRLQRDDQDFARAFEGAASIERSGTGARTKWRAARPRRSST